MALRVIVAGMGYRGRDWIGTVRADAAFDLVACVEIDDAVRRQASSSLSIPPEKCFRELQDTLDKTKCDAVIVATSAEDHTESCRTALARGIAVLVEKPFTLRLAEAVELVELAAQKGAHLMVAQNYRYMRSHRTAKRVIGEGTLGKVSIVTSQYYRGPHRMAESLSRLHESALWGVGVHHLDALRYVLDQRVVGVAAQSFTAPRSKLSRGASMQALLTFDSGTRGFYSATYESSGHDYFEGGQEFYQRYVGDLATLHVFHRWLVLCGRGRLPRIVRRGARKVTEESVLLRQLERALLHGEEPESSGRDNLQTMGIVEACVRAAAEQRWINPQELLSERE